MLIPNSYIKGLISIDKKINFSLKKYSHESIKVKNESFPDIIFFCVLFLYQFIFIFQGIGLVDEGFLAVFYKQIFADPESVQYSFLFWFTGIIGGTIFSIFPNAGLIELRLAGVIVSTLTAFCTYQLLREQINKKYLKIGLSLVILFINNDIKEINYNNLSALLYVLSVYLLYKGLTQDKMIFIFLCGSVISLSFFTRISNIVELGVIPIIIYYSFLNKKSIIDGIKKSTLLLTAFTLSSVFIILVMHQIGHLDIFRQSITHAFNLASNNPEIKSDEGYYSISNLIGNFSKQLAISISISTLFIIIIAIASKLSYKIPAKLLSTLSNNVIISILFSLFGLILISKSNIGVSAFVILFYGLILISFLFVIFSDEKKELKLIFGCGVLYLLFFPLSSSGGIYTAGKYSLWLALPVTIHFLFSNETKINLFFSSYLLKGKRKLLPITNSYLVKKLTIIFFVTGGLYFSYYYPYFDRHDRLDLNATVDNKYLKNIYTSGPRAAELNKLLSASKTYIQENDYIISYDCTPLVYFLTDTRPYISNSLLFVYEPELLNKELNDAYKSKGFLPVIIRHKIFTMGGGGTWPEKIDNEEYFSSESNLRRHKNLEDFIKNNNYKVGWESDYFAIYLPQDKK